MTIAVRHGVIDESVVVNMLIPISNHTSVAPAFGTLAFQNKVETVACNAIMQRNNIVVYAAVGLLLNINIANTHVFDMGFFQAIQVNSGILANVNLNNLRAKEVAIIGRIVAEKEPGVGPFFHNDEHTTVYHQVDIGAKDVNYLYSPVNFYAFWHINKKAVLGQHGVKGGDCILISAGQTGIITFYQLWILLGSIL